MLEQWPRFSPEVANGFHILWLQNIQIVYYDFIYNNAATHVLPPWHGALILPLCETIGWRVEGKETTLKIFAWARLNEYMEMR